MLVSYIENGQLDMDSEVILNYSTFSMPFLRDERIPCILIFSKRKYKNYVLIRSPLLLFPHIPPLAASSISEAIHHFQHSPYYETDSM